MPIYEMNKFRKSGNPDQQVALLLALHSAPILKGIKMANLLRIKSSEVESVKKALRGTKISYRLMKARHGGVILYLYRLEELRWYLFSKEVKSFLKEYGYECTSVEEMLDILSDRIQLHKDGRAEFPHEIGAFLGYPMEDVQGFLQNNGENFSYLGYWKVYHKVEDIIKIFKIYDEERERVVREVISGKSIQEIAV